MNVALSSNNNIIHSARLYDVLYLIWKNYEFNSPLAIKYILIYAYSLEKQN